MKAYVSLNPARYACTLNPAPKTQQRQRVGGKAVLLLRRRGILVPRDALPPWRRSDDAAATRGRAIPPGLSRALLPDV